MTSQYWHPEFVRALKKICGEKSVLTDPTTLLAYENDALSFHRSQPDCVVIPNNYEQLKQVVQLCKGQDFPFTLRGAGTSLSGGPVAVAGGLVIHVSKLRNILEVNVEDQYCVVEPGVVLNRLNQHLSQFGLFYPPDPSSSGTCTVGGNVAENSGGLRCFRYGVTANYVLGLEMILPTSEVVRFGGPAGGLGSSHGCDWRSLMIGSEGVLGVIGKVWLRLKPLPEKIWTFLAVYDNMLDATRTIVDLVQHPAAPVALEFVDNNCVQLIEASSNALGLPKNAWVLLVELDGPAALVDGQAGEVEKVFQTNRAQSLKKTSEADERQRLWIARKASATLSTYLMPDFMLQDVVIPRSHLSEVLQFIYEEAAKEAMPVVNFFHAGDGNLHPSFPFDGRIPGQLEKVRRLGSRLMEKVISCGGTLTGEHGIGSDKLQYVDKYFGKRELQMQLALAETFNPNHQLNPGKALPQRTFVGCCLPNDRASRA